MLFSSLLTLAGLQTVFASPLRGKTEIRATAASATISDKAIFTPPSNANWTNPGVLYARSIQLQNGDILATWENYSPEPPLVYFPIYKSTDNGSTWAEVSKVQDTVNGWGLRYQPNLYQLPEAVGEYPAGTVLCAGNSIPQDLSKTKLDIYASKDSGETWEFVSSLGEGGEALPNNGLTPIWEPLLMQHRYVDGTVVAYYSDQRDPKYAQKLVHTTSTNLKDWSAIVNDIFDPNSYTARPGMAAVTALPNGQWMYAYEVCGAASACHVHYRLCATPYDAADSTGIVLTTTAGGQLTSSPTLTWSPVGGANGTLVISSGSQAQVFTNQMLGAPDAWVPRSVPNPSSYSRWVKVFENDLSKLIIASGGVLGGTNNKIEYSVVDINTLISS
ncbi:hypothetical protein TD95_002068 [Thielaviopsis punctulata]|uniref:Sialidase domain-containing protein n=1 Tax=Thielaviopsis punctulata TaxID=72032 RepID=A0A0F4ZK44_9PEZI|nr:hypothetical protein TD95_002068 [Thielaviopsis punctulata]